VVADEAVASGKYDMIILDEICTAVTWGLFAEETVIALMNKAAPGLCVVLTGRGATPAMIELADTVTEMTCLKHGMEAGLPAQKGVEF
jgi:cob(I)alamin adenosyltransferase